MIKKNQRSESILPGNYTIEEMAKTIENSFKKYGDVLRTQINTPVCQMVIQKVDSFEKIKFDKNLSELLGIDQDFTMDKICQTYEVTHDLFHTLRFS